MPKVHDDGLAKDIEDDVGRLDVAVDEALDMRVLQTVGRFGSDINHFANVKRPSGGLHAFQVVPVMFRQGQIRRR